MADKELPNISDEARHTLIRRTGAMLMMESMLSQTGPFTSLIRDMQMMPVLIEWIGADPMKLRELLNYVHDRGVEVGARLSAEHSMGIYNEAKFRVGPNGTDYGNLLSDVVAGIGPTERKAAEKAENEAGNGTTK